MKNHTTDGFIAALILCGGIGLTLKGWVISGILIAMLGLIAYCAAAACEFHLCKKRQK